VKGEGLVRYVALLVVFLILVPVAAVRAGQDLHTRVKALKSEGRYGEAARILEKAAEDAEGRRRTSLLLEAARLFAWAKDYERSLGLYDRVLGLEPENRAALVGKAQVLAWAGRRDEALGLYRRILARDPYDREARLGLARLLAWQKNYRGSVAEYRKVLEKDPADREAMLGVATTLWWEGDFGAALTATRRLLAINPEDSEARTLEGRIRKARGPALDLEYIDANDSDDNDLRIFHFKGYYAPSKTLRFDGAFSLFEARRFDVKAKARVFGTSSTWRADADTTLRARLSIVAIDSPSRSTTNLNGGLSVRRVFGGRLRTGLSWNRYTLLDTAALIRNNIRVHEFSASAAYDVPYYFTAAGGISYGDYSDGNSVKGFFLDLHREFQYFKRGPSVRAGYRLDYRDFRKDLTSGYFDPSDFTSDIIYAVVHGDAAGGRLEYEAGGEIGWQHYNSKSEYTSAYHVRALYHLNRDISLRAGYRYSRSALESAAGFRYEEFRLGITYLF